MSLLELCEAGLHQQVQRSVERQQLIRRAEAVGPFTKGAGAVEKTPNLARSGPETKGLGVDAWVGHRARPDGADHHGGRHLGLTPAMAAIMALVDQKYGRQGQANFTLYPLAQQKPAAFHDVTLGSNNMTCVNGTADCQLDLSPDRFYSLRITPPELGTTWPAASDR